MNDEGAAHYNAIIDQMALGELLVSGVYSSLTCKIIKTV